MKTFYNHSGAPICYTDNDIDIFSFRGEPLGYIYDDKIYNYRGYLVGWFLDNWIYDRDGNPVFFSENSYGGPVKPIKQVCPIKSVRSITPIKQTRQVPSIRPIKKYSWSRYSDASLFR